LALRRRADIFTPHLGLITYQGGGSVVKLVIEDLDSDPHVALVHRKLVPRELFLVTPTPAQVLPRAIHLSEKNSVFLNCMSRGAFTTQKLENFPYCLNAGVPPGQSKLAHQVLGGWLLPPVALYLSKEKVLIKY
jgi:hypothetical protein